MKQVQDEMSLREIFEIVTNQNNEINNIEEVDSIEKEENVSKTKSRVRIQLFRKYTSYF